MKNLKNNKVIYYLTMIGLGVIAIGYMGALFKIVLFKNGFTSELRGLNLIPFQFVNMFTCGISIDVALKNVIGNVAIFIPLGILMSNISRIKGKKVFLACALVSVLFEVVQYVIGCGSADIDDVILNTVGGVIGVGIYHYFLGKLDHKVNMPISTVLFLGGFGLAGIASLYLFEPSMLPIEVKYENEEVFQGVDKESFNAQGVCVDFKDGILKIQKEMDQEDTSVTNNQSNAINQKYKITPDTDIILEKHNCKYSPNGNVQKVTIVYSKVSMLTFSKILEEKEKRYVALWIDEEKNCNRAVVTIF